jgi:predicted small integral membrane protein
MSAMQTSGNVKPASNLFTALLALACLIVVAAAALVAYKNFFDYGTLFKIVDYVR